MYKLLIADDEAFQRKIIRIMIKKLFSNIDILEDAKTGSEAVLLAKKYAPHIIIMDINMPEKSGLEAQKSIIEFLPNIKTIILSSSDNFNFAQQAIRLGVTDYILKPAKSSELKNSIDKIISQLHIKNAFINNSSDLPSDEYLLKKSIIYINKNFNKNISLDSVAKYIHLNPQYFSKYFKNNTNINFIEYVSKIRVEASKKLLVSTDKSIYRISLEVGYIDPSYFTKVFIKYEGISPHKYRLLKRKNSLEL